MSPELRAMLAEQDKLVDQAHDSFELVLYLDSVEALSLMTDTLGAGSAMPAPYFQEEE